LVSRIRSRSCSRSRSFVLVLNVAESAASYRTRHADICPGARHLPRTPRRARFGPDSDQTRTSTLTRMVDSTQLETQRRRHKQGTAGGATTNTTDASFALPLKFRSLGLATTELPRRLRYCEKPPPPSKMRPGICRICLGLPSGARFGPDCMGHGLFDLDHDALVST